MCTRRNKLQCGFTLLEVLVALFIFSIVALMLASALRSVINTHSRTERQAERLRTLQLALLIMSRDIEQTIDRPIIVASGREEPAFLGSPRSFTFTHTGLANSLNDTRRSALQRTQYFWSSNSLWRAAWVALDQAPDSQAHKRLLLADVTAVKFEYLDNENHFQANWPAKSTEREQLPRAVKVTLTLSQWGSISQIYMIPSLKQERKHQNEETPSISQP